jgi:nicotinate-nucleotide adenylyltransferase
MIGLLGGTFNPIHIGHIHEARAAKKHLGLTRVIFMPSNIPPHKQLPEQTPSPEHRLEMVRLATKDLDFAEISELELKRAGVSYTIDTVCELMRLYPGHKIAIICGSDMLLSFETWKRSRELLKLCVVAAFPRGISEDKQMARMAEFLNREYSANVRVFDESVIPISSTQLREGLRRGQGNNFLPACVYSYIKEKGLYGVK